MEVGELAVLLAERRYGDCRAAAEAMLRIGGLNDGDRAQAFLALSCSLAALCDQQAALGPAELAVHFSRSAAHYDVTGHALCHLASLYFENRLHKRAVACLDTYFRYFTAYTGEARHLEGWVLSRLALFHQALGRGQKALEYYQKAYRWHADQNTSPPHLDQHRGELTWQYLKLGQTEPAAELLALTAGYLKRAPNDLDCRARYQNSLAYHAYLRGEYAAAFDAAVQVVQMKGAAPARKTQACLTLHYAARAQGLRKEARGLGALARIHASVARRPDLEEEATRALLQLEQSGSVPLIDELFRTLGLQVHRKAAAIE